jgi:MoxR-like ATPase
MHGRYNVSYEDIEELAAPVLRHRIKVNYAAVNEKLNADKVISMLVKETKKVR